MNTSKTDFKENWYFKDLYKLIGWVLYSEVSDVRGENHEEYHRNLEENVVKYKEPLAAAFQVSSDVFLAKYKDIVVNTLDANETISFYSDFYKDVYGYRPRQNVFDMSSFEDFSISAKSAFSVLNDEQNIREEFER